MNFSNFNFLRPDPKFIKQSKKGDLKGYTVLGEKSKIEVSSYGETMNPILKDISTFTTLDHVSIDIASILDEINCENSSFKPQGYSLIDPKVEGFMAKKKMKLMVLTNEEIAVASIVSLPHEFVFEYKESIEDYLEDLQEGLGSLCRMIMMEDDKNLLEEARDLKKSLKLFFEKDD